MTADEFTRAAIALLRTAVGWQSAIARRLGVESRTVRRWLADGATPPWVDENLAELMGGVGPGPWPRDEWLIGVAIGADSRSRNYVVHLQPPRFAARIVECDDAGLPMPVDEPADVTSGTVYVSDGSGVGFGYGQQVLCEVDWIDQPSPGEITGLMEAASDAIEAWEDDDRD